MTKQEIWTKRCQDGRACSGKDATRLHIDAWKRAAEEFGIGEKKELTDQDFHEAHSPFYIPDNVEICDACLLAKYMPEKTYGQHDSCDQIGLGPLYWDEEDVVKALRKATNE